MGLSNIRGEDERLTKSAMSEEVRRLAELVVQLPRNVKRLRGDEPLRELAERLRAARSTFPKSRAALRKSPTRFRSVPAA